MSLAGIAVALIGLLGVAAPGRLVDLLARWPGLTRFPLTLGLRIGFAALFLAAAPRCRLPELIRVVGVLELLGALVLLVSGAESLKRFVAWWLKRTPWFVRGWCSVALAIGLLLAGAGGLP